MLVNGEGDNLLVLMCMCGVYKDRAFTSSILVVVVKEDVASVNESSVNQGSSALTSIVQWIGSSLWAMTKIVSSIVTCASGTTSSL